MVIICLFVCTAMRGQQMTQKTIDLPDYESSLDVSHLNGALLNNARFEWAKTRSGADKGARWIDRISNMPDYLLSYYDGYGEKVKEVLNGKSNWLSDPTTAVYDSKGNRYVVEIKTFEGSTQFDYTDDFTESQIQSSAVELAKVACDQNWKDVDCFVSYLVLCLGLDFPEAF